MLMRIFIAGVMQGLMWRAVNEDGTLTYTPDLGFSGLDPFIYTITDGTLTALMMVPSYL